MIWLSLFSCTFFSSQVNFMITDTSSVNSRKRRAPSNRIAEADAQLYRDLAQASGGQAIEITKSQLPQATAIIKDSSNASLVISQTSHYWLDLSFQRFQLFNVSAYCNVPGDPSSSSQEPRKGWKLHFYDWWLGNKSYSLHYWGIHHFYSH